MLDFPPRLNVEEVQQDILRQEFHRVAARNRMLEIVITLLYASFVYIFLDRLLE